MNRLNKSVWGVKYKWQLQQNPPPAAPLLLSFTPSKLSAEERGGLPLRPPQSALFLAIFQCALFTLGQDWAEQYRNRVSPNAHQRRRQREAPPMLPIVLPLPFAASPRLVYPGSFRAVPCPDQGSFDLLQTIGNIIHQRLLSPLFLSFSLSPVARLFSPLFHSFCQLLRTNLYAKRWALHFVVFHPNLSIMFHSLPLCLFNSKAKSRASFSQFRFCFVLCLVNERRTRLSGITEDLCCVSLGIESVFG